MKMFIKLNLLLFVAFIAFACSANKEQQESSDSTKVPLDTISDNVGVMVAEPGGDPFKGEYLIGDGNTYIVPVADTWEMRDGTERLRMCFTLKGKKVIPSVCIRIRISR
jgi:hypothetical protein